MAVWGKVAVGMCSVAGGVLHQSFFTGAICEMTACHGFSFRFFVHATK